MDKGRSSQHPNKRKIATVLPCAGGELNVLVLLPNQASLIIHLQLMADLQLMPLSLPKHNLKPHSRRQNHPESRRSVGRRPQLPSLRLLPPPCLSNRSKWNSQWRNCDYFGITSFVEGNFEVLHRTDGHGGPEAEPEDEN
ncbi:hypothetical protein Nepgr_026172 [Nepenthes gracilis]|uniref:Uncharacterized protein n=1 Tax=Nepenthes gracilis TaxID=150966 RepID=A0AAD3Y1U3_NEPGR|nr:hypothetical protein Nepgr_026172 [Nepenthes gracilis]